MPPFQQTLPFWRVVAEKAVKPNFLFGPPVTLEKVL